MESKLPNTGITIFTQMSTLANQEGALNLSQGFPEFDTPKQLLEKVKTYTGKLKNQYVPLSGLHNLLEKLGGKYNELHNLNLDTENICVTAGGTQALYSAISAFVHPGDEVVLFDPAYDSYGPAVKLHKGKPVHISLGNKSYELPWGVIEERVSNKTKMIIINTPHNPTGAIISKSDIHKLEQLIERYPNLLILSDEVYEHIVFDGQEHHSPLKSKKLWNNLISVFSFGKTYHATGWKLGYAIAPEHLMKEFKKVHQYQVFCCNSFLQYALADTLDEKELYTELASFYQAKRDLFRSAVSASRFELLPCSGTYFQLLSYKEISDENDLAFARRLTKEFKIASIPISVFYENETDNKVLRFCFAKNNDTLERAGEILCKI
jgi:methionine aminotransferase